EVSPPVSVYLGSRLLGHSPLRGVKLPAGRHRLKLVDRAAGVDTTVEVDVPRGRAVDKHVAVAKGRLRIKAIPWADVTVDGQAFRTTPTAPLSLAPGAHVVKLSYRPQGGAPVSVTEHVTIKPGADELLERDLRR